VKPKPAPKDDPLETRVHDLELDFAELTAVVERMRLRLNALLPERHYCRHCKALISELSEVCGSCGKVLRVPANPKAGQPR
jgi:hypothetical protein